MPEELLRTQVTAATAGPGRSIASARGHHFVVDGPAHHGGPGEEITPAEAFLAGIAACGVLLVEGHARETGAPVGSVQVAIEGIRDAADPSWFTGIDLRFRIPGVERGRARELVAYYQDG
jgi:uncharacterized OsmC-like protein